MVEETRLVLRQDHHAGERMFVDYAGATIPIHDPRPAKPSQRPVFVAVLGASNYTFAEATLGQDLRNWIGSHMRASEFFGGVAEVLVPDFVPGNKIPHFVVGYVMWPRRAGPAPVRVEGVDDGT